MNYITFCYILMILTFISYVSGIWARYGVLDSISQSYYELPTKFQPLFILFCWGYSLPAIILGSSGLMFLAGSGIAFAGAAAAFKEEMTMEVHVTGAVIGVLFSQLAILFQYGIWQANVAFLAIAIPLFLTRFIHKADGGSICPNRTWWIEIAAFLDMSIVLGIKVVF